jgi:hypothetical protein
MTIVSARPRGVALAALLSTLTVGALSACSSDSSPTAAGPAPSAAASVQPDPTNLPVITVSGKFAFSLDGGQGCVYVDDGGKRYNIVLLNEQTISDDAGKGYLLLKPDDLPQDVVLNAAIAARPDVISPGKPIKVTGEKWTPDQVRDTICRPYDLQIKASQPITAG